MRVHACACLFRTLSGQNLRLISVGRELVARGHNVSILLPSHDIKMVGDKVLSGSGIQPILYHGHSETWEDLVDELNTLRGR